MNKRIAMLGGGNMARALVAGLVSAGLETINIDVLDRNADKCEALRRDFGVNAYEQAGDWLKAADVVVLAVKPQGLAQTIATLKHFLNPEALFISIAAGIRIADIARWLGSQKLVRAMPNTPCLIKAGVVGLFAPATIDANDKTTAYEILSAMGEVIETTSEQQLDLLSTVSGSGPAYVFRFIEALESGVVRRGFDEVAARRMAILTVLGAAKLAAQSTEAPAKLRANVTSKGGTTAEALRVMDERDFMEMMDQAIQAAYDRNQVLADELGKA